MNDPQLMQGVLVAVAAGLGVFVLGFPVHRALVHWNIVDRPNERSSHSRPTARGGGVAVSAGLLAAALAAPAQPGERPFLMTLLAVTTLLAIVSFIDDLRSLSPAIRFACQAVAAVAVLAALGWPRMALGLDRESLFVAPRFIGLAIGFLWITGYSNAFNFMDGVNGIASGQAAVTGVGMGLLAGLATGQWGALPVWLSFVLAAVALGFLPHNFPRARMFLGDVGSIPMGFLLAVLVLWLAAALGWWLFVPLALLHANFVLDTGVTLVRRLGSGQRWYEAHRDHFYQRLTRAGKTHAQITLLEMALQGGVVGLLAAYIYARPAARLALAGIVILVWAGFFAWAERSLRKAQRDGHPRAQ